MPDLDYAKVMQRLGLTVGDGADPDETPDTIWCDGGTVQIVPLNTYVKVADGSPVPWTGGNAVIECTVTDADFVDPTGNGFDGAGYLLFNGKPYVWVVDLTSTKVNPFVADPGATHRINYVNVTAEGTTVTFPSVDVRLTAAGDGSSPDNFNDLTLLSPVVPGSTTPIIVGPRGVSVESAAINPDGELVFDFTDGTQQNAGEIPVTAEALEAASTAVAAAGEASGAATTATTAAGTATTQAGAAVSAKTAAETAQSGAVAAKGDAEAARDDLLAQKGAPSGLAPLDADEKLPEANVPDRLGEAALTASTAQSIEPGETDPQAAVDARVDVAGQPQFEPALVLRGTGIDLTGTTDSTAGLQARIAAGLAAGIKKFVAVPNATYKVHIDGTTHRTSLAWFTDQADIQILGRGATIRDTTSYTSDKLCNIFGFTRCTNVEVTGWNYIGEVVSDPASNLSLVGAAFVYAEDNCRNVKVDARLTNARYGVRSGDYTQVAYGECRGFDIKITGSMIGYPIAITLGHAVQAHVDVDGFHRASYLAGVTGARITSRHKNQYGATIANLVTNALTLWAENANYTDRTARGCKNVRVDSTDTGSTTFATQAQSCGLSLQWVAQGTEFSDIEMTFHVRSTDTVASTIGGFQLESTAKGTRTEYPYNWEPFISITDLRVRGVIDRTGQTVATNSLGEIFMRTYDSGDAGLTHIPAISKVDVQVAYKKGSVQTRPWFVELPGLTDTVVLDRVQAAGVSLTISAPTGVMSLKGGSYGAVGATASPHSVASLELTDGVVTTGVAAARITRQRVRAATFGWSTMVAETKQDALATNGTATVTAASWLRKGYMVKGITCRVSYTGAPAGKIRIGITGDLAKFAEFTMVSGVNRIMCATGLPYYPPADEPLIVTFVPDDGTTFPNGPLVQLAVYAERFSVDSI